MKVGTSASEPSSSGQRATASASRRASMTRSTANPASPNALTVYTDMRRMEAVLGTSDVDWVALRPPRLLDRPATGRYRLSADGPRRVGITHGDLATARLDCLDRPELRRRTVFVANEGGRG